MVHSLALAALASLACAAPAAAETVIENGTATWYGGQHVGRMTSSGEVFSATELTAAHPYLPLGARVRVTLDDTGSSVVVRINDRQPSHGRRIIDLSREAASRLGMLARGAAPVTVTSVEGSPADAAPVEVAMAPDGAGNMMAPDGAGDMSFAASPSVGGPSPSVNGNGAPVSAPRRGRPHTRRGRQAAAAALPCCHAPFATRVRHSVQRQAAQRRL